MNFKKILAVLFVAGILSIGILNLVGDLTVLKSGTYDCTNEQKEKSIFVFDISKHTWDSIEEDGNKISDDFKALGAVMVLGKRDESTKLYELAIKFKNDINVQSALSVNGTKFSMENRIGEGNTVLTCIKR
jgi:hypothetical protein